MIVLLKYFVISYASLFKPYLLTDKLIVATTARDVAIAMNFNCSYQVMLLKSVRVLVNNWCLRCRRRENDNAIEKLMGLHERKPLQALSFHLMIV